MKSIFKSAKILAPSKEVYNGFSSMEFPDVKEREVSATIEYNQVKELTQNVHCYGLKVFSTFSSDPSHTFPFGISRAKAVLNDFFYGTTINKLERLLGDIIECDRESALKHCENLINELREVE